MGTRSCKSYSIIKTVFFFLWTGDEKNYGYTQRDASEAHAAALLKGHWELHLIAKSISMALFLTFVW